MGAYLRRAERHLGKGPAAQSEAGKAYKKIDWHMHKAVVGALKKAHMDAVGVKRRQQTRNRLRKYRPGYQEGRIGVYGPTSSAMGRLAKEIQNY